MKAFDLDDEFEEFMQKVNPTVDPTSVQYKESRRVFMAGAGAMFIFCTFELANLPEADGVAALERLRRELNEFFYKRVGFTD
jgi:hypothetical protein